MKNKSNQAIKWQRGFTLLEILIALFIFTLISVILTSALHSIFAVESHTEKNAQRLSKLQLTLLLLSRDLEQSIDRPIVTDTGTLEASFIGTSDSVRFTRGGFANPLGASQRSTLQRVEYSLSNGNLIRTTWLSLDQADKTQSQQRILMNNVDEFHIEYLDQAGHFSPKWPAPNSTPAQVLPIAVKVSLTLTDWGKLSQLYIISGSSLETIPL